MQVTVTEEAVLRLEDMSDDEFFGFCARNSDYRIERTAGGDVVIMPGTGGKTGFRNSDLTSQLHFWSLKDGRGIPFDSGTLFRLPDRSMRSADAAWVLRSRLKRLSADEQERFLRLAPDFVIELTSPSDRLTTVRDKMESAWMANGCSLGWILDAKRRNVHVYGSGSVEVIKWPDRVVAGPPVEGFTLDLQRIWDPVW